VITNFFTVQMLWEAIHKPLCWFYYVDDTLITWAHRLHKLMYFFNHLNCIHQNIHFTLETEMATFPALTQIFTGHLIALWAIRYTINLPTLIPMYKGWAIKFSPCTATFNDLLCFNPLVLISIQQACHIFHAGGWRPEFFATRARTGVSQGNIHTECL
jgi:hypothetical protein